MNAKQAGVVRGRGGILPCVCVTCMPDRFSRLPSAAPLPASPGSLQKAACYFSFPGLSSHWLYQDESAVGKVVKAEQKQLVPTADVLTAVCKMSLSALPPA